MNLHLKGLRFRSVDGGAFGGDGSGEDPSICHASFLPIARRSYDLQDLISRKIDRRRRAAVLQAVADFWPKKNSFLFWTRHRCLGHLDNTFHFLVCGDREWEQL